MHAILVLSMNERGVLTGYACCPCSGAVVRTTHMTGIVTDIGLMLAQIVHKMLEHNIDAIAKDKSQRRNRYKVITAVFAGCLQPTNSR